MKKIFIPVTLLLLVGCVDSRGFALQDQFCSDKGGVFEYANSASNFGFGFCNDNTRFEYMELIKLKLRPEFYPKKEK